MGESYHIIPGTTAKSGISLTEDLNSSVQCRFQYSTVNGTEPSWSILTGRRLADQERTLSGEASAIFEVDLNGLVSGNALAFTWLTSSDH